MRGLLKIVVGSALGAALGIVISQRKKKHDALLSRTQRQEVVPAGPGPAASATPEASMTPVAAPAPVAPVAAAPVVVAEPEPELIPEPEPVFEVAPEPEQEPEPVLEVASEPVVEAVPEPTPAPEPVSTWQPEPVILVEPEQEPASESTVPAEGETEAAVPVELQTGLGAEAPVDVVVAPEVLDEPLPGSGWESTAAPIAEEEVEEIYPAPAVESTPAEDLPVIFTEEPVAEAEPEPETEPVAGAAPVTGQEPEPVAPSRNGDAAVAAGTPSISADDLRARIEETRRRIRRELEEPFLGGDTVSPGTGEPPTFGGAASAAAAPMAAPEIPVPVFESAAEVSFEPVTGESPSDQAAAVAEPVVEPEPELESEPEPVAVIEPAQDGPAAVDYDAMKARIEATRSRLKAKAFDAMMTGESSLLGRDAEEPTERVAPAAVDDEVDQSIESSLREQED